MPRLSSLLMNYAIFVMPLNAIEKNIYDVDLKVPLAIIMGSEQKGINKSVINLSDESVKLPMFGKIESLNVSVACGIFLYEVVRQRI